MCDSLFLAQFTYPALVVFMGCLILLVRVYDKGTFTEVKSFSVPAVFRKPAKAAC